MLVMPVSKIAEVNCLKELFERWLRGAECRRYKGDVVEFLKFAFSGFSVIAPSGYEASIFKGEDLKSTNFDFTGNPNMALFLYRFYSSPIPSNRERGGCEVRVVLCRPCDARAIVELCKRNQLSRKEFILVGFYVPQNCRRSEYCRVRFSDLDIFLFESGSSVLVLLKRESNDGSGDRSEIFRRIESITEEESADRVLEIYESCDVTLNESITSYFDRCVKCMGCIYECPICVCKDVCFVKESGKGEIPPPPQFLVFRMAHVADSCVNCGQCDDACCANIPISRIFQKVQMKYWEETGYIPGINYELSPRLR